MYDLKLGCSGLRSERQLDQVSSAGEGYPQAKARTIAVHRRIEEATGHHSQGSTLQGERLKRRQVRGYYNGAGSVGDIKGIVCGRQTGVVSNEAAVSQVVNQGYTEIGFFHVYGRRIGAAVNYQDVRVAGVGTSSLGIAEDVDVKGRRRRVTTSTHNTISDQNVLTSGGEVVSKRGNGIHG